MKKIFSLALTAFAFVLCLFSVKALDNGSITISRTQSNYGTTYNAYRLFDLSYDSANKSYAYTLNDKWGTFFTTGAGKDYVVINTIKNENGKNYVTLKADADLVSLSKLALKYAKDSSLANDGSTTAAKGATTATISNLKLGYYLVDSSLGALCSISTTDLEAKVKEKNAEPTISKEAQTPVVSGSAKIGDVVNYSVTINVAEGYENYVFTDKMTTGLTYLKNATVKYYNSEENEVTGLTQTISNDATDNYTFKVDFTSTNLSNVSKIVVTYGAMINKNAIDNSATQTNEAVLSFGDNNKTDSTNSSVDVVTYNSSFHKTDGTNELSGARFKLYDALTDGNEIKVVKVSDGVYRVAEPSEENGAAEYIEAGNVVIKGLANTNYFLEEIKAPEGYTRLGARVELAGNAVNKNVINTKGTVLPSTGGAGTVAFILIGALIVVSMGTLLITKFRLSKLEK